jgi:hypothetical protein
MPHRRWITRRMDLTRSVPGWTRVSANGVVLENGAELRCGRCRRWTTGGMSRTPDDLLVCPACAEDGGDNAAA